jgi:hypothetical protein
MKTVEIKNLEILDRAIMDEDRNKMPVWMTILWLIAALVSALLFFVVVYGVAALILQLI